MVLFSFLKCHGNSFRAKVDNSLEFPHMQGKTKQTSTCRHTYTIHMLSNFEWLIRKHANHREWGWLLKLPCLLFSIQRIIQPHQIFLSLDCNGLLNSNNFLLHYSIFQIQFMSVKFNLVPTRSPSPMDWYSDYDG